MTFWEDFCFFLFCGNSIKQAVSTYFLSFLKRSSQLLNWEARYSRIFQRKHEAICLIEKDNPNVSLPELHHIEVYQDQNKWIFNCRCYTYGCINVSVTAEWESLVGLYTLLRISLNSIWGPLGHLTMQLRTRVCICKSNDLVFWILEMIASPICLKSLNPSTMFEW